MRESLRKAGTAIRNMDDAYSAKIAQMYDKASPAVKAAAYMVGGAHPSFRKAEPEYKDNAGRGERAIAAVAEYAIPAANAVPKYALPAAGVTLAGQALVDLAATIGQQTESAVTP